jgi:hypothetical protein
MPAGRTAADTRRWMLFVRYGLLTHGQRHDRWAQGNRALLSLPGMPFMPSRLIGEDRADVPWPHMRCQAGRGAGGPGCKVGKGR